MSTPTADTATDTDTDSSTAPPASATARPDLRATRDAYVASGPAEDDDLTRARQLADAPDPWDRSTTLHATGLPPSSTRPRGASCCAGASYVLATAEPGQVRPEHTTATLRWLAVDDARAEVGEDNVAETLARVARLLAPR